MDAWGSPKLPLDAWARSRAAARAGLRLACGAAARAPRVDTQAKLLAKELLLAAPASKNGGSKGRSRSLGAPTIKPGKSRRHGGYGIG